MRNGVLRILLCIICTSFFNYITFGKSETLKPYHFKFQGKITYKSGTRSIGLYGAKVALKFIRKSDGMLLRPKFDNINPSDLNASIQSDGSYNLDIQIKADLSAYSKIFLEVYPGDTHGNVYYDSLQFITKSTWGNIAVWNNIKEIPPVRGIKLDFDENKTDQFFYPNIEVMFHFGATVRYLKIASEFGSWFFNKIGVKTTVSPITVAIVKTFKHQKNSGLAAYFWPYSNPPVIEIKFNHKYDERAVAHEFGHYLHFLLNRDNFKNIIQRIIKLNSGEIKSYEEGIGDFLGMCIRKYGSVAFGDILSSADNFEKLPFDDPAFEECSYCQKFFSPPRWASYLWNIFDGQSQNFDKSDYTAKDNDDIDGEVEGWYKYIFTNVISKVKYTTDFKAKEQLHDIAKKVKGKEQLSVSLEHLFQFIFKDNTHKVLPAQVKKATLFFYDKTDHLLIVETNHYLTDVNYKNLPESYKLYGKKEDKWVYIGELPAKDKLKDSIFIPTTAVSGYSNFRISTANKFGESLRPYEFKNSTLPISLEGPNSIYADIPYQWKAKVVGGTQPFKYNWRLKKVNSSKYISEFLNTDSPIFSSVAPTGESFDLEVWAYDSEELPAFATMHINTIIRPLKANIIGPPSVVANELTHWKAEVTGGVPPYSYNWVKTIQGTPQQFFLSQSNACGTKSDKPFLLKLYVEDSKGNTYKIEKPIQLNILAPINISINGPDTVYLFDNSVTWKANITGGEPPYEIRWMKRNSNEFVFHEVGKGNTYQKTLNEKVGTFYLKAIAKDINGVTKESVPFKVVVQYSNPEGFDIGLGNQDGIVKAVGFSVYPNPATGTFKVEYKLEQDAQVTLSLVSTNTNRETLLYQQQNTKGTHQQSFNVGQLPIGNYILKLTQKDKNGRLTVTTEKVTLLQ